MTIFVAGSEPGCGFSSSSVSTNTSYFRSNFSRACLASANPTDLVGCTLTRPAISATGEFWLHFYMWPTSQFEGQATPFLEIRSPSGELMVSVNGTSTSDRAVSLDCYNPETAASASYKEKGWNYQRTYGMRDLVYGYADGELYARLYVNGGCIAAASVAASPTDLRDVGSFWVSSPIRVRYSYFSEFILADVPTIGAAVKTLVPTGTDVSNEWAGTHADVDEVTPDGSAMTANGLQTARLTIAGSNESPGALVVNCMASTAEGGAATLSPGIRYGGVDYFAAAKDLQAGINRAEQRVITGPDVGASVRLESPQQVLLKADPS